MHVEEHQERFPPLTPLYRPQNPSPLALLARETCPAALLPHPSPITPPHAFLLDPQLLHCHSQRCPFQGFFGAGVCSYGSKMAPLAQETCPTALLSHPSPITAPPAFPLHPHSLCTPLYSTTIPKIAHFKAFLELAWAHVGPRWLKMALNHLSELSKWSRNNFGKKNC